MVFDFNLLQIHGLCGSQFDLIQMQEYTSILKNKKTAIFNHKCDVQRIYISANTRAQGHAHAQAHHAETPKNSPYLGNFEF